MSVLMRATPTGHMNTWLGGCADTSSRSFTLPIERPLSGPSTIITPPPQRPRSVAGPANAMAGVRVGTLPALHASPLASALPAHVMSSVTPASAVKGLLVHTSMSVGPGRLLARLGTDPGRAAATPGLPGRDARKIVGGSSGRTAASVPLQLLPRPTIPLPPRASLVRRGIAS